MGNDKTRPDCKDDKGIIGMLHHRALSSAIFCIKKTCLQLSSLFYYLGYRDWRCFFSIRYCNFLSGAVRVMVSYKILVFCVCMLRQVFDWRLFGEQIIISLEWTTRKMLEQHRQMKGNMIQLVSRLMAFDIDFYFRIAKVSVSTAKVKLNLWS